MGISSIASSGVGFGVGVEELLLLAIFMARSLGSDMRHVENSWGDMPRVTWEKMNGMRHVGLKEKSDMPHVIVHEVLHEACETL
ncbi:hypothetical protein GH714_021360 [Hevea brasiliensis]|uniref:Uncharacterized protein n=1 Tax=Hevea brasiliensis TaxID=3981 RepID=A0A6A6LF73_HEVBR|nr:hypothetical protein GH714_021360 [Hevea brasiliensis]